MNLEEMSLAFRGCTGNAPESWKNHLLKANITSDELEAGFTLSEGINYILSDIEKLLSKAILNIASADLALTNGHFSWGFVTSYYSNFYSVQALNRMMLNFSTWTDKGIKCEIKNYITQEIGILSANKSTGSHESQFQLFYSNYSYYRNVKSVDRYWNIGVSPFILRPEARLRNELNYSIEPFYYYELELDKNTFEKIIKDNLKSPFTKPNKVTSPVNYGHRNLQLAVSRVRVIAYFLNYLANSSAEYRSYFESRCEKRKKELNDKFPNLSKWIVDLLDVWLKYDDLQLEDDQVL